ncbi:MAG TPA: hypothetical protein VLT36_09730 [Candidatus Dormibacteraeota bacterium]|nr:hypothetical protein [Candidatus Dormibacteraeota bacterium]
MNLRRNLLPNLLSLALLALVCQGCIAFPPLIQVEHKENGDNKEVLHRLDAIDRRLDALEQKK